MYVSSRSLLSPFSKSSLSRQVSKVGLRPTCTSKVGPEGSGNNLVFGQRDQVSKVFAFAPIGSRPSSAKFLRAWPQTTDKLQSVIVHVHVARSKRLAIKQMSPFHHKNT